MIIRQLQPEDCFAAKALWQEIFCDTAPFANWFFAHRFTPTLSFGAYEDDRLVSMALGRRVRTEVPGMETVLISGVSTLPEFRRQGLMNETMHRLLDNAKARGYELALLSPAIPDLYRPFGFEPLTYAVETTEIAGEDDGIVTEGSSLAMLYRMYWIAAKRHFCMLRRTLPDMRHALEEYGRDNGRTLLAPYGAGYLCYLPGKEEIEVTECLADTPKTYRMLLRAAANRSPSGQVKALLPVDSGLAGTLVRPQHGLALKDGVHLEAIAADRRAFCIERY